MRVTFLVNINQLSRVVYGQLRHTVVESVLLLPWQGTEDPQVLASRADCHCLKQLAHYYLVDGLTFVDQNFFGQSYLVLWNFVNVHDLAGVLNNAPDQDGLGVPHEFKIRYVVNFWIEQELTCPFVSIIQTYLVLGVVILIILLLHESHGIANKIKAFGAEFGV